MTTWDANVVFNVGGDGVEDADAAAIAAACDRGVIGFLPVSVDIIFIEGRAEKIAENHDFLTLD